MNNTLQTDALEIRRKKQSALNALVSSLDLQKKFEGLCSHSARFELHGVDIHLSVSSKAALNQQLLQVPTSWVLPLNQSRPQQKAALQVFWMNELEFSSLLKLEGLPLNRLEDPSPDCEIRRMGNAELAIQRDFMAAMFPSAQGPRIYLAASFELADAYFNALRWILPRYMLSQSTALMHSSAVVGNDGWANLFLGPSGAGKTTVTKLAGDRLVLGDDMNVLSIHYDRATVELGYFGQGIRSPVPLGLALPLKALYFLKQDSINSRKLLPKTEAMRRFAGSCANLFWPELGEELSPKVFKLAIKVAEHIPCYELSFSLDGGFWKYVD